MMNTISIETLLQREEGIGDGQLLPISTCLLNIFRRGDSSRKTNTKYEIFSGRRMDIGPVDMEDWLGYDDPTKLSVKELNLS